MQEATKEKDLLIAPPLSKKWKRGHRQRQNTYTVHDCDCDCDCDKKTEVFRPPLGWGNWRRGGKPAGWGDWRRQHKQSDREYFPLTGQSDSDTDNDNRTTVFRPPLGWGNWRRGGKPAGWGDWRHDKT